MVSKIKEFLAEPLELKDAIKKAIDYCLDNNVLKEFLQDHRSEVEDMLWREYNEETATLRQFLMSTQSPLSA